VASGSTKDVVFEKSINGTASGSDHFSLKVDATQLIKFSEPVGTAKALQSLDAIAPTIQLKDVTTVGNQTYSAATGTTALTLLSNATLRVDGDGQKFEPNGPLGTTHTSIENSTDLAGSTIFVYNVPLGSDAIGKSISSIGFATGNLLETTQNRSLTPLLFEKARLCACDLLRKLFGSHCRSEKSFNQKRELLRWMAQHSTKWGFH
jgi:hypothetical protein